MSAANLSEQDEHWWDRAVFYQIYPRSYADSNGDGVGDLDGITAKIGYLELLGVQAIWLNPVTKSPMADHGYDVSNPREIDPLFGGLTAMHRLVSSAHRHDIKVIMDLVPNHTSIEHPWFAAALDAGRGSPERARYIFADGKGLFGEEPPNNWPSVFGGPAWTRIVEADGMPGQWYLHLFAPEQPDLNWDNPEVFEDFAETLRFWLDRGIDGFRLDVAHGMAKAPGLPDLEDTDTSMLHIKDEDPRFNNEGVHVFHRQIRKVMDEYPHAVTVGEIWVNDNDRFAAYVRPDELHLGFNFKLVETDFDAAGIRSAIENSLAAVDSVGAAPTWTLSNHDVEREVTRYGGGQVGVWRARAMALVMLALPGSVFIYNGSELGLPNVDLPDEVLQDPVWERSGHTERGRDGCRVPIPWEGTEPPFGFSTNNKTWLPMPHEWSDLTVERQLERVDSTLSFYRRAIELRKTRKEFKGTAIEWYGSPTSAFAFRVKGGGLTCVLNAGKDLVTPPPGEVLLSSGPLVNGKLPPNTAAWIV